MDVIKPGSKNPQERRPRSVEEKEEEEKKLELLLGPGRIIRPP